MDRSTSDGSAHLGRTYYFYPNANCSTSTTDPCQLDAGFISSRDGGASWGGKQQGAGPVTLTWFMAQGFMVGDYIATTFSRSLAFSPIAVASAGTPTQNLNEAVRGHLRSCVATSGGASITQGAGKGTPPLSFVVGPTNR